jgi:transposase
MPQSLSSVYLHVVFSTKDRRPFLGDGAVRAECHAYLAGISKEPRGEVHYDPNSKAMKASAQYTHTRREIGVDISKGQLDVFDGTSHWQVPNNSRGITHMLGHLGSPGPLAQARLTCESTGRYGHLLAAMCLDAGLPVTIANPRAVRDFARATGRLAKTDRIDSTMIAAYAAAINPPVLGDDWKGRQHFVELHSRMRALITAAAARKAAAAQSRDRAIRVEIRGTVALLKRRAEAYAKTLQALVEASPAMKERRDRMTAIKGVGKHTALALLATMPELGSLNRQQAGALAGLAPMNRDSGTMRGKRCIQAGRAPARGALYMAAVTASRCHPTLAPFYKRLRETGKKARSALCAVARKLLVQINSALKSIPAET